MSPKRGSKRSSPRKAEVSGINSQRTGTEVEVDSLGSPTKAKPLVKSGFKLRLKVSSSGSGSGSSESVVTENEPKIVPKIKLNFSRSNESVVEPVTKKGKRGRPKKDKSAVKAAAMAALQPNENETEERKSRRRAAEEKIKKSAAGEPNIIETETIEEGDGGKRKRGRKSSNIEEDGDMDHDVNSATASDGNKKLKRKRRTSKEDSIDSDGNRKTSEFIDITTGTSNTTAATSTSATYPNSISTVSFNPHENEFIQRCKTFLNISQQHDTFMFTSSVTNPLDVTPFKSIEDAVDKLLPFHLGIGAGQYSQEELEVNRMSVESTGHLDTFNTLQERFRSIIHQQSSKKVATELLLLEQRLCLEEEKFLLIKLKNEYASRFMKSTSSSSTSASNSSRPSTPSRSDSVINQ